MFSSWKRESSEPKAKPGKRVVGRNLDPVVLHCDHNHRCRYTHGFYCEDYNKSSNQSDIPAMNYYTLWMVMHNINADSIQKGGPEIKDALAMRDKIGINIKHDDYEKLIDEAEVVMKRHGASEDSATLVLK